MPQPDVVVVGAGAVGLCCACALAERGLRVVVLERDRPGAGASWGNAGWVVPSHSVPLAEPGALRRGLRWLVDPTSPLYVPPRADRALWGWLWRFRKSSTSAHVLRALPCLVRLQLRSLQLYQDLVNRGLEFGFCRAGSLSVFLDPREYRSFLGELHLLREQGISAEVLEGDAVRAREPLLRREVAGGVYFPEDAHLDPARLVRALAEYAGQLGVQVRTGCPARALRRHGRGVEVDLGENKLYPRWLVVAAGAWSTPLLRAAGLRLPVLPAKGYSVTLTARPTPAAPVMLSEARVAVTPLGGPDGARLRLAGTLELGVWEGGVNPRRVEAIRRAGARYLQVDPEGGEVWTGLRLCTPDGLPVVGSPSGWDSLVLATGHGTLGISLAPVTGELVASVVVGPQVRDRGKTPAAEGDRGGLELLSPDRFR